MRKFLLVMISLLSLVFVLPGAEANHTQRLNKRMHILAFQPERLVDQTGNTTGWKVAGIPLSDTYLSPYATSALAVVVYRQPNRGPEVRSMWLQSPGKFEFTLPSDAYDYRFMVFEQYYEFASTAIDGSIGQDSLPFAYVVSEGFWPSCSSASPAEQVVKEIEQIGGGDGLWNDHQRCPYHGVEGGTWPSDGVAL